MKFVFLSVLLATILSVSYPASAQVSTGYSYAYLAFSSRTEAKIAIVNPTNLDAPPDYRDLGFPPDWRPPVVRDVSPDGEWIIFVSASNSGNENDLRYMRLVNLVTGETRDFESGHIYVGDYGISHAVYWSPNNRFFAFNALYDSSDILVYSLEDQTTTNVTNDEQPYAAIVWSPDSTKLASLVFDCLTIENCVFQLHVIDLAHGSRQTSPNLVEVAPMVGGLGCNLSWSPDGRYVSFFKGCFAFSVDVAKEVFIWDTVQNELKQATNFTLPAFQPGGTHFSDATYMPIWYDADTLLIGARYKAQPDSLFSDETYLYKISTDTLSPLYEGETEEWVFNPVTDQIAARVVTTTDVHVPGQAWEERINGSVQVFELNPDETSRTVQRILPLGCDLAWSPDGTILAYTVRRSEYCADRIQRFAFIDDSGLGIDTEYIPLLESGETPYGVANIGWIAIG